MSVWIPDTLSEVLEILRTVAALFGVAIAHNAYQRWITQAQAQEQRQQLIVQLPRRFPDADVAVDDD